MNRLLAVIVIVIVLLACSTAEAGWTYVVPSRTTVVYSYWPVGPVYAYPGPVFVRPAPMAVPFGVVAPARVVYPAPVVIRSKVYVRGRPVRNAVRAVLP